MSSEILQKRREITDRHDAALRKWPNKDSTEFIQELNLVIDALNTLAADVNHSHLSQIEQSRTYRFLGDAYYDLSQGQDIHWLERGRTSYQKAEELLQGLDASLEQAKLNHNYANTLMQLSQGEDLSLLEAALERYQAALAAFKEIAAEYVPQVEKVLKIVNAQIKMARRQTSLSQKNPNFSILKKFFYAQPSSMPSKMDADAPLNEASLNKQRSQILNVLTALNDRLNNAEPDTPVKNFQKTLSEMLQLFSDIENYTTCQNKEEEFYYLFQLLKQLLASQTETLSADPPLKQLAEEIIAQLHELQETFAEELPRFRYFSRN